MAEKKFLTDVYGLEDVEDTRDYYRRWAESYDAEVAENGYVTPKRCAEALAGAVADLADPLIDLGCGTGLSGLAFRAAGFTCIDGCDLTEEMLEKARARGVYRRLWLAEAGASVPFEAGAYTNAAAVGVMSPGHAPASLIDAVMAALPPGGCFTFSLNDHALEDPTFEGRIREHVDTGAAQLMFREHGPHLPGIGLEATVYVLRKS